MTDCSKTLDPARHDCGPERRLPHRRYDAPPSETTARYLDRIAATGSCRRRLSERLGRPGAMQAAEAADRALAAGARVGPFHGMPFALKDIFHVEGTVTTCGSKVKENDVSTVTGTVVKRLTAAGGTILGKTRTVEHAFGAWGTNQRMGTPMNPWDMETPRIPGGSSSGSAAAVAAGMAPCGIGSDTGGSVRLPAALCGLVGTEADAGPAAARRDHAPVAHAGYARPDRTDGAGRRDPLRHHGRTRGLADRRRSRKRGRLVSRPVARCCGPADRPARRRRTRGLHTGRACRL